MRVVRQLKVSTNPQGKRFARYAPPRLSLGYTESDFEDQGLAKILDAQDRISEQSRDGAARVHLSSIMSDWCSRRYAIHFRHGGFINRTPQSADRLLWEIGRAVERHIRAQLIAARGAESVLGIWRCVCKRTERTGFGLSNPPSCRHCFTPVSNYGELQVVTPDMPLDGNPDLILATGRVLRVVECKSIKLKDFEALEEPKADHMMQASGYAFLLPRVCPPGFEVSSDVTILYGAKDYPRPGVRVYKDFTKRARVDAGLLVSQAMQEVAGILAGDKSIPLPPRLTACSSSGATRAKNCSACALCFSLP